MSKSPFTDAIAALASNHQVQLAMTAVGASLVTSFAFTTYNTFQRNARTKAAKRDAPDVHLPFTRDASGIGFTKEEKYDEEIIKEQLARNIVFLGEEGIEKIRHSFVIIVGAGGVGSWAALMLLRSGVEHIRIIDFDQVTLSSLNRHAVATHEDVGTPKVIALKRNFEQIAPWAKIEPLTQLFNKNSAPQLLAGNPDFIIDAIDNIDTKLALLKYCHDNHLPIISSMGAGAKADPTRVQISDISQTFEDPLARAVRRRLRRMDVESGITVVYSTEKPNIKLLPLDESRIDNADEYATLPDFRSRILPVLGTIPSIFGMTIATYIITTLASYPIQPLANKNRDSLYARIHRDLQVRENKTYGTDIIPLDKRDVGYAVDEIWRGRSVISGASEKLTLLRWDKTQPLSLQNCVVLTKEEAAKHDAIVGKPEDYYPREVVELVHARFKEEREFAMFR
ncbi:3963_t:CDS:2 [Ambispora gerdemannii]|uniref:3963_t:CDS:1 n=1 Tax=Ambispora gerdemannii TaxID=144530 RepID=A0A9N9AQV4_9GLOM|nr:3963_t:CDS:2 [Ambispora gerdemannii]